MRLITLCLLSIFLMSCDSLTTISVDVESETTVDDGGLIVSTLTTLGFTEFASFDVSGSAAFKNNNATKNNIGESYVTAFTLEVMSPNGQTLDFIDEMEVYIGDGDNRTSVAYIADQTDTDVTLLYLQVEDDRDISQYLRADETVVDVDVTGRPPENDTTIKAIISFSIKLQF